MASDLRALGATLKVITYLDRIGRYGYDVAKAALDGKGRAKRLVGTRSASEREDGPMPVGTPIMRDEALALLDRAVEVPEQGRREGGHRAARGRRGGRPVRPDLPRAPRPHAGGPAHITACARHILVARHLERVGDNAGNRGEGHLHGDGPEEAGPRG